jgi:glucose/arabinose dehydrogenase
MVPFCLSNSRAAVTVKDTHFDIQTVVQGLNYPTAMAFLNANDILVLEKDEGKVVRVLNGSILNSTVLSLDVNHLYERGLLGIAIQNKSEWTGDNYKDGNGSKYVFLFYTEAVAPKNATKSVSINGTNCNAQACPENQFSNRLYRYEYKDNKLVNPKLLIDIPIYLNNRVYPMAYSAILKGGQGWTHYPLREGIHQGGKLVIGPDKNVYLVTGDGGGCLNKDGCYRSMKNGFLSIKSANKLNGTEPVGMGGILHVTADGKAGNAKDIIGERYPEKYYYAYGIRNSFGLDFDPLTGDLWDTENGPHFGDEINLVKPGFNSGWAKIQGMWPVINYTFLHFNSTDRGIHFNSIPSFNKNKLETFEGRGEYSPPEFSWNASIGVTSIKFLDTDRYGEQYKNDILVGDAYGRIYHFDLNQNRTGLNLIGPLKDKISNSDSEVQNLIIAQGLDTITDMQLGPDGYLYVLSYTGKIFKLIPKNILE